MVETAGTEQLATGGPLARDAREASREPGRPGTRVELVAFVLLRVFVPWWPPSALAHSVARVAIAPEGHEDAKAPRRTKWDQAAR